MNWKAIQMQCKPLDMWLTHLCEAKQCIIKKNRHTSLGSIFETTLADIGLKHFAEQNASFWNGRQISVS